MNKTLYIVIATIIASTGCSTVNTKLHSCAQVKPPDYNSFTKLPINKKELVMTQYTKQLMLRINECNATITELQK